MSTPQFSSLTLDQEHPHYFLTLANGFVKITLRWDDYGLGKAGTGYAISINGFALSHHRYPTKDLAMDKALAAVRKRLHQALKELGDHTA